jgi:soluble lytic murein transglycosylase-like protein
MEILIGLTLIGAAAIYYAKNKPAQAGDSMFFNALETVDVSGELYDNLYRKHGSKQRLPWQLLKAIATIESNENPTAVNRADPSYGIMQILCSGSGDKCTNKFPAIPEFTTATKTKLLQDADFNIQIGAKILSYNLNYTKLGATNAGYRKAIAMYNRWAARNESDGSFANQTYVNRVWAEYQRLLGATEFSV